MLITLVIIPIAGVDDVKLIESFDSIPAYIIKLQKDRYFNVPVKTGWKMFMYSNEYLSKQLVEALPILLKETKFHYFSFYKLILDQGITKFSISPRLFDSRIRLIGSSVYPVDINSFNGITILDGFIYQC
jgi:hypothetical protein